MALFNYANREITAKIVYYGPGVCGKTTSLQYIHERIAPAQRGRLLSLATETDRTIFFDLLPLKLGEIRGFKLRFQLYTVPGQVKYNKTRKLVLQGADALVFVADSQVNRREKNLESFRNLADNLKEQGKKLSDLPLVFSYNKRDLDNILSVEQLNHDLNPDNLPYFPAVATKGVGVMETLEAISKTALQDIEQRLNANIQTETSTSPHEEEEISFDDDEMLDLTGAEEPLEIEPLSLSNDLDTLELDGDFDLMGEDETLESKPIGYDTTIQIEEFEIQADTVAQTGTLKESEFFDLKEIEEQALRELDEFIDGNLDDSDFGADDGLDAGDDALSFDSFGSADEPSAELDLEDNAMFGTSTGKSSLSGFGFVDSGPADEDDDNLDFSFSAANLDRGATSDEDEAADDGLDFSVSASPLGDETDEEESDGGLDFAFSANAGGQEADADDMGFSFSAAEGTRIADDEGGSDHELDFGASLEPDSLLDFTLGERPGTDEVSGFTLSDEGEDMEPLELSENELDFSDSAEDLTDDDLNLSFDEDTSGAEGDFSSFTASDAGLESVGADSLLADDEAAGAEELVEFTLDDEQTSSPAPSAFEESLAVSDIESLNLSDADLDLSFGEEEEDTLASLSGLNMSGEESGPPYDFRITDSVRFEMQHSEEISSVTPFEKQLDELSDEMFTAEEEPSRGEFEPEPLGDNANEEFQALTDERKRQLVLAKYLYQQGEVARAKQTTRAHIQAVMMYYLAVETALKAVAMQYESCNPAVASLRIMLDSIEEETHKTISGKKSILDNIVALKDQLQLETVYPDQDACELAARVCDRFLATLAEEFLAVKMNELSPILPEPVEK